MDRISKSLLFEQEQEEILKWLSPIDSSSRHSEFGKKRAPGTGTWLLESHEYSDWLAGRGRLCQTLCCHGNPGSGKSVMTSLVIDELRDKAKPEKGESKIGVAYFYCDYKDQIYQTPENILGSLLKQLLRQLREIPQDVLDIYKERVKLSKHFELADVNTLLEKLKLGYHFWRVYVCLDAIDEVKDAGILLECLQNLPPFVHILLTIRSSALRIVENHITRSRYIEIEARGSDIRRFLEHAIANANEPEIMDDEFRNNIYNKIADTANGTFLLPSLQMQAFLDATTIRDREETLTLFPPGLDKIFTGTMERIEKLPELQLKLAAKIIALVHLAEWPLTLKELIFAISIRNGQESFDPRGLARRASVLNYCHGLIVEDQKTSLVRFFHPSFQEYLRRQDSILGHSKQEWNSRIARACLTFLQWESVMEQEIPEEYHETLEGNDEILQEDDKILEKDGKIPEEEEMREVMEQVFQRLGMSKGSAKQMKRSLKIHQGYPEFEEKMGPVSYHELCEVLKDNQELCFLDYAAAKWGHHLRHGADSPDAPLELAKEYLFPKNCHVQNGDLVSMRLLCREMCGTWGTRCLCISLSPLHVIAYYGIAKLVTEQVSLSFGIDCKDDSGKTPLSWAAARGHEGFVKLLLDKGATVDWKDRNSQTPLALAVLNKHTEVARLLVEHRAAVESEDAFGMTPLSRASQNGHEDMVKLLLQYEAQPDKDTWEPYFTAIRHRHKGLVRLFLEHGAPVNYKSKQGTTPLKCAARVGQAELVNLLIQWGAMVDKADEANRTPLSWAAAHGYDAAVQVLLQRGASVHTADNFNRTPLSWAAANGHDAVAQLLIQEGAEVDLKDGSNRTPLSWAASGGHVAVSQLLISNGAMLENVDENGRTPLLWAIQSRHESVARLLIERGSSVDVIDVYGQTPLSYAEAGNFGSLLTVLVEMAAPLDLVALTEKHKVVVELLIQRGSPALKSPDERGRTALWYAQQKGREELVELLRLCH
ncbi:hypothetical protein AJ79_00259 [Helicocarpus griseus UAMH5409]|uniref:Nephrocystin 3-like N-terminal domain-containing protein n=1 Tax=Helicocarpus griseus UAMH5409 TaxID=1447875 RepID=A0A2B7YBC8_9EURO|nr:hypothetical protein AJ79_00259 [Helicocarpus griseus UAMH5409]